VGLIDGRNEGQKSAGTFPLKKEQKSNSETVKKVEFS
jgi:hypothetical protein